MMRKCPNCGNTIQNKEICPICGKKIGIIISKDNYRPQINTSLPLPKKKSSNPKKRSKQLKTNSKKKSSNGNNQISESNNQKTTNVGSITSSLLGILCIVGVMLVVVSGVLTPDNTTSVNEKTIVVVNNTTGSNQLNLQVKVLYNGHWAGSIGLNEDLNNYDENSSKTVEYEDCLENDTLSASIQKKDSSNDELKVQFLKNGLVLKEESTKTPYGIVTIAI